MDFRSFLSVTVLIGCAWVTHLSMVLADTGLATAPSTSALSDGSLLSLHVKDESPRRALEKLAEATGTKLNVEGVWDGNGGPKVTVDMNHRPFWDVVAEVCAASGVMFDGSADGELFFRQSDEWNRRPVIVHGPYRVDAYGVDVQRAVTLGKTPEKTSNCKLSMSIQAEPAIHVVSVDVVRVDAILDDAGRLVTIPPVRGYHFRNPFRKHLTFFSVGFEPDARANRISVIKGELTVCIQDAAQLLEMSEILKAHERVAEVGGIKIVVTTKPAEGGCDLDMQMSTESRDHTAIDRVREVAFYGNVKVVDEKGRPYRCMGSGTSPNGALRMQFRSSFPGAAPDPVGPPEQLIWSIPTKVHNEQVPFEFKDLPLP